MHIIVAIIFIILGGLYIGYLDNKDQNRDKVAEVTSWIIIIFGVIMMLYHGHLWIRFKTP
jgi:intracellular septation protein A